MTQTTAMTAYDCNVSDVWSLQLWDGREKPNDWANDWRNVTPTEALHLKMASLAKLDRYPNCRDDSHLFLSEYEKERAQAVVMCNGCLLLLECGAAADEHNEKWGVWAGKDRTRRPKKLGRPPRQQAA
jgi:hypothetical protein